MRITVEYIEMTKFSSLKNYESFAVPCYKNNIYTKIPCKEVGENTINIGAQCLCYFGPEQEVYRIKNLKVEI